MKLEQIAIAIDQLFNTLLGGYADETLSARAWRVSLYGNEIPYRLIDALFFWQNNHCAKAYASELQRKHLPKMYSRS